MPVRALVRARVVAVTAVLGLLVGLAAQGNVAGATPAQPSPAVTRASIAGTNQAKGTFTAGAAAYPCRPFGMFPPLNPVASVQADRFTWPASRTTKVGNGSHDINWKLNPYRDDSWVTWFHGLLWAGSLVEKSTRGLMKTRDPNAIDGAVAIARDWVNDNPSPWPAGAGAGNATHTRTEFLLCLRAGLQTVGKPVPSWLDASLLQHAAWLRKNVWKDHNIGTDQTLAVMGVGCVLGRPDLRSYASSKLAGDIGRVIDAQGANNEQSAGYARWNWKLWGYVENAMATCGVDTPATRLITARRAGLATFLDHATKPDGYLSPIGDTQPERAQTDTPAQQWLLSNGKVGAPLAERVKIYRAGFVFGRSGWGTSGRTPAQESMYALHFGPTRLGHGHNDHTSLTWNTRGRAILADSGTGSYTNSPWREYYTGPSAHNQLVMPRMKLSLATKLTRSTVTAKADYYQLADAPLKEARRTRDVIVLSDPDIVVAFDRATSTVPTSFAQTWHLPYTNTAKVAKSSAVAMAPRGAGKTTLLRLTVPGAAAPAMGLVRGSTKPIQGWEWTDQFTKHAAPVVTATTNGRSAAIATAIVASGSREAVSVTAKVSGRTTTYTFRVGSATAVVSLASDGRLTRLR